MFGTLVLVEVGNVSSVVGRVVGEVVAGASTVVVVSSSVVEVVAGPGSGASTVVAGPPVTGGASTLSQIPF